MNPEIVAASAAMARLPLGPAGPDDLADAFALVFRHLPDEDRRRRVSHALTLVEQGELDRRGVFVVRDSGGPVGALVCALVPGAGSLIWPPACTPADCADLEDALVRCACAWLRSQGARLAQCLLPPAEEALATGLLRNGFARITTLSYLDHCRGLPCSWWGPAPRLRYEPYKPDHPDDFHRTLLQTYQDTLDCPEVNGLRTIDEVIEGHRAQGRFNPGCWLLARERDDRGEPVGVLLLVEQPGDQSDWEVSYMGIVPAARRRGFGRELLFRGLREARLRGARRVMLCVDDRNRPAWQLYRSAGFEPYDQRIVLLDVWR
jgi:ribosomal protein S18 acetylase RimI-like enzyme